MADALCCSMYWLGLHNKNSNFIQELKQFGRAGKHWISSISTTPLHYLAIDHDVGRWGTYFEFFEIPAGCCPLTPSFSYLLLRHKIGLDFISGKSVNFKSKLTTYRQQNVSYLLSFYRYGAPKKLLSDQGREFVNTINADLAPKINIDRMITAAYHPQRNGLDER